MDFVEKTGKTVDEAVTAALIEMGVSSEQVDIEVLDEGAKGILGLFSKNAKVRVTLKKEAQADEILKELTKEEVQPEKKAESKPEVKKEKAEQPVSEVPAEASEQPAKKSLEEEDVEKKAALFLMDVLEAMGIDAIVKTHLTEENVLEIDLEDSAEKSGMGMIIGKRGNTLDSLQYLTTMVINKNLSEHVRVKLDTENYRERRQKTLENLAVNLAKKVKKTGRRVILEPMNPYERRIIHSTLQSDRQIETHSEGEEPYRKVVISLKRKH